MRFGQVTHWRTGLAVKTTVEAGSSLRDKYDSEQEAIGERGTLSYLEVGIAGAFMPYHWASRPTPTKIMLIKLKAFEVRELQTW